MSITRTLLFTLGFLFFTTCINAQSDKNDTIYYSRNWEVSAKSDAYFYRLPRVQTDSGFKVIDCFASNGKMQMCSFATTAGAYILDGYTIFFDSLGHKVKEGMKHNGLDLGTWKYYYPQTDILYIDIDRKDGILNGPVIYYDSVYGNVIERGYFENGLRQGNFIYNYPDGKNELFARIKFVDNRIDSIAVFYYRTGAVKRIVEYRRGRKLKGHCYDEHGLRVKFYPYVKYANTRVSIDFYKRRFQRKLRANTDIIVSKEIDFTIRLDKRGRICNTDIKYAKDDELMRLISNFINNLTNWRPLKIDGNAHDCELSFRVTKDKTLQYSTSYPHTY